MQLVKFLQPKKLGQKSSKTHKKNKPVKSIIKSREKIAQVHIFISESSYTGKKMKKLFSLFFSFLILCFAHHGSNNVHLSHVNLKKKKERPVSRLHLMKYCHNVLFIVKLKLKLWILSSPILYLFFMVLSCICCHNTVWFYGRNKHVRAWCKVTFLNSTFGSK